jgi:type I restriction enzyme S subunit
VGRAVLPVATIYGNAASEHLVRIRCATHEDACYLWAVLASEVGYWALVGTAFGSSIPSLDCQLIGELTVPWIGDRRRTEIVCLVQSALQLQNDAIEAEREAVRLVEQAIEEAT